MKKDISIDLDTRLNTKVQAETLQIGTPPEVRARIELVEKYNYAQSYVDKLTTSQILSEYTIASNASNEMPSLNIDIDSILTEWSWRCDKGYPDFNNVKDRIKLQEVLDEMNIDLPFERIHEDEDTDTTVTTTDDTVMASEESFIAFMKKYRHTQQEIGNLDRLYDLLMTDRYKDLIPIILNGGGHTLKNTKYSLNTEEKRLFDLISSTVHIENGNQSELWFAIMYNGKIKGGVAGETGIESDVDVGESGVSIKNYGRSGKMPSAIDFGTLDKEASLKFNSMLNLFMLLTGKDLKTSNSRNEINNLLLKFFDDPDNIEDIKNFLKMSEDSQIGVIKRYGMKIREALNNENPDKLVEKFIDSVNEVVKDKLNKVEWWAVILKSQEVHVHSSKDLEKLFISTGNRLNDNIANFKGGHLFVKTSSIKK